MINKKFLAIMIIDEEITTTSHKDLLFFHEEMLCVLELQTKYFIVIEEIEVN